MFPGRCRKSSRLRQAGCGARMGATQTTSHIAQEETTMNTERHGTKLTDSLKRKGASADVIQKVKAKQEATKVTFFGVTVHYDNSID